MNPFISEDNPIVHPPLEGLLRALERAGMEFGAEDVADAFWLRRYLAPMPVFVQELPPPEITITKTPVTPPLPDSPLPPRNINPPTRSPVWVEQAVRSVAVHLETGDRNSNREEPQLNIPAPSALPNQRVVLRALQPLITHRPSQLRLEVDIDATARRRAEEGLLEITWVPSRERWLSVALVIDTGVSMEVWQPTLRDIRNLLEKPGLFRHVRTWYLATDTPDPTLRSASRISSPRDGRDSVLRSPGEIVESDRNCLVLLVTDGVSKAWYGRQLATWVEDWSRVAIVAVVNVLPHRMWGRTAIGACPSGVLSSAGVRSFNGRLAWEPEWETAPATSSRPIPVVSLNPADLEAFARLVAGRAGPALRGVILTPNEASRPLGTSAVSDDPSLAVRLVDSFRRTASVQAEALATLLAAAPAINLPVIRLLSDAVDLGALEGVPLVKGSTEKCRPEHLAEVWLGGLLQATPETSRNPDPDAVLYTFRLDAPRTSDRPAARAGPIRQLFLDALPRPVARRVLRLVSEYIARNLKRMRSLPAFLRSPSPGQTPFMPGDEPFAYITLDILRRLGGQYAAFAERLLDKVERVRDLTKGVGDLAEFSPYPQRAPIIAVPETALERVAELHQAVRRYIQDAARAQKNDHLRATVPYVDLMLAFCFATLGSDIRAQSLVDAVQKVMEGPIPPQADQAQTAAVTRNFLFRAFKYRIDQMCNGKPHTGSLSPEVLDALDVIYTKGGTGPVNNPYKLAKYVVDIMRELSRIVEPDEKPDPYADWTKHGDNLKKQLAELHRIRDPAKLAERIRKLYRDGVTGKPLKEVQFYVLHEGLPLAERVSEAFTTELLAHVPIAITSDMGTSTEPPNLPKKQGELFECALRLAGHFNRDDIVKKLVHEFTTFVLSKPEQTRFRLINVVARQCLRNLKKFGLRDEMVSFLTKLHNEILRGASVAELRKKHTPKPDSWSAVLQTLLNLASGWLHLGLPERATPILQETQNELLNPNGVTFQAKDYTELAKAYVSALGQTPFNRGSDHLIELFSKMDPKKITNTWTTAQYYSLFHLQLVEETVFSVCWMLLDPPLD